MSQSEVYFEGCKLQHPAQCPYRKGKRLQRLHMKGRKILNLSSERAK
jgi:hypothetical protein